MAPSKKISRLPQSLHSAIHVSLLSGNADDGGDDFVGVSIMLPVTVRPMRRGASSRARSSGWTVSGRSP
jgi:hypothetical protein